MGITKDQVRKVALLARLELPEEQLDVMTGQLAEIVTYIDQLSELDTDHIEPMAHAMDLANVFAEDNVEPSLDRNQALANAPRHDGQCYLVPAVLGDS